MPLLQCLSCSKCTEADWKAALPQACLSRSRRKAPLLRRRKESNKASAETSLSKAHQTDHVYKIPTRLSWSHLYKKRWLTSMPKIGKEWVVYTWIDLCKGNSTGNRCFDSNMYIYIYIYILHYIISYHIISYYIILYYIIYISYIYIIYIYIILYYIYIKNIIYIYYILYILNIIYIYIYIKYYYIY